MPDIIVYNLSVSQCVVLKMGDIYDFLVYCSDGEREWRGACHCKDLQNCIEAGIGAFIGRRMEV